MDLDYIESVAGKRLTKAQLVEILVDALDHMSASNNRGNTVYHVVKQAAEDWRNDQS